MSQKKRKTTTITRKGENTTVPRIGFTLWEKKLNSGESNHVMSMYLEIAGENAPGAETAPPLSVVRKPTAEFVPPCDASPISPLWTNQARKTGSEAGV